MTPSVRLLRALGAAILYFAAVQLAIRLWPAAPRAMSVAWPLLLIGASAWILWARRWPPPDDVGAELRAGLLTAAGMLAALIALALIPFVPLPERIPVVLDGIYGWVVSVALVSAVIEEIIFRGLVLEEVRAVAGPTVGIGISALLFGLGHLPANGVGGVMQSVVVGLVLGWVAHARGGIWAVIVAHLVWNAVIPVMGALVS